MSSDTGVSRSAKRQKTLGNASPPSTHKKDATFWFEDGNIVLISNEGTEFRVHLGVLSFNAEFFRDMSGVALPDEEERGYTTIEAADSTQDLIHFLHALYTRSLRAIAMARENDVPMILPAAFYFAPIISPSRLVMLHLKLALDVLATILAGREQITQSAYSVAWSWLFQRLTADMCHDPDMCDQRRLSVVQDMWRSSAPCLFLREMPHESEKRRGESDSEGVEEWTRKDLDQSMESHWIGPMPPEGFISTLPSDTASSPELTGVFDSLPQEFADIQDLRSVFLSLLSHHFQSTEHRAYIDLIDQSKTRHLNWDFDVADEEPFDDPPACNTNQQYPWIVNTPSATSTRGRMIEHTRDLYASQRRSHLYSVIIGQRCARFLRWDRGMVLVSRSFPYRQQPHLLIAFLSRFAELSPTEMGYDDTASLASAEEETLARDALRDYLDPFLPCQFFKIRVPDTLGPSCDVIIGPPVAEAATVVGRCTTGFPAYNIATRQVEFLKDSWRDETMHGKESEFLRTLNKNGVRYVPTLTCGGDVPGHVTTNHIYVKAFWNCGSTSACVRRRQRNLTKEIGKNLLTFQSGKHLLQVTLNAFVAHRDAFEKCGLLHRDVSGGNILILSNGEGMLNDWDLAIHMDECQTDQSQLVRTGTWRYTSTRLLNCPSEINELQDDLESFIHVVMYHGLRYIRHNKVDRLPGMLYEIYDSVQRHDGEAQGGLGKRRLFVSGGVEVLGPEFAFSKCHALNGWFVRAMDLAWRWISYADGKGTPLPEEMRTHQGLFDVWDEILQGAGWPDVDNAPYDQSGRMTALSPSRNGMCKRRRPQNRLVSMP
ncbi:hypothetical protein EDD18DRAFT_1465425 [Armillaria luteobubalina]|uniref:BTB domain-containing protein n=1 Tax=Armillaria luteobubalina TaxID=153913 RepID=A0AA39PX72_9AGAR|nr:hypothetical protein EDD18DRAFT_1465425 [Armillaria luteobubalina]